jgi:PAS domain S-box-containing protein
MTRSAEAMHVLVADDDEASRYLVESLLRGAGYEVRSVADGEQALEAARDWRVDLLVSDILMPRMDGYRLVQEWKRDPALAAIPVMFYTATYTDPADERLAADIGVDRFVTKPQEPDVLLGFVDELLASERVSLPALPTAPETEVLREYSERLVHKLEEKVTELDCANAELRLAISVLSDEVGVKNALIDRLNTDIAERERGDQALREANEGLDAVIACSPLPIVAFDRRGHVTLWNKAAERVFGWTEAEVLGRENPLMPEELRASQERLLETLASGVTTEGFETYRRAKDGRRVDVVMFIADTVGERGQRTFVVVYQDVTERRRSEQLKSDLVSNVGHELRTPLTAILGFTELLQQEAGDADSARDMAVRIHGKALELATLVDQLLDTANIQAGSTAICPVRTDIGDLLRAHASAARVPAGFTLDLDVPPTLPEIAVDRVRLGRAIDGLISNAFKYSPEGGRVLVSVSAEDGRLRIAVADEGVGIAGEDIQRIFDRFTQADMSSTREFAGMGLGLYTARQIVEAHGGSLTVSSVPAEGSTFVIDLPLA